MIIAPKVYFLGLKIEDGSNLDGTDRLKILLQSDLQLLFNI